MEDNYNFMEPIQTLMDNVKKDIFLKTSNKENKANNKEIINSLFKLLDYQITLINQILLFNQNIAIGIKKTDAKVRIGLIIVIITIAAIIVPVLNTID